MTPEGVKRKISAILSADVVGYTKLMEADEEATVRTMQSYRKTVSSLIEQHDGSVIDSPGDNILSEFGSVVDAVQCAVEIQHVIKAKNAVLPEARRMEFRIGINLGDVIAEEGRLYGDGINIAARIEGLADAGGICISGSAYEQIRTKLSLGYEDLGEQELKNITDTVRVYRIPLGAGGSEVASTTVDKKWRNIAIGALAVLIIGAVAILLPKQVATPPSSQETASAPEAAVSLDEKPSIAVLPFDNLSGDPDQEYFVDGMTEEIIARLSKSSQLLVIARNSTFTYKGKSVKVQDVSKDLGARYVVEGSVRKSGDRVRITAQMIDATTGNHIWGESFDRDLEDVFVLQDEMSGQIASSVVAGYVSSETRRAERVPTSNLSAYDALLRGSAYLTERTREANEKARNLLETAVELDERYAEVHAALGVTYSADYGYGWDSSPQTLEKVFQLGRKAISLDDNLPQGHALVAWGYRHEAQYDLAISEMRRAIDLDPNNASFHQQLTQILIDAGRSQEALETIEKAMRLNPKYPTAYLESKSRAHLYMDEIRDAITAMEEALSRDPNSVFAHLHLAYDNRMLWIYQRTDDITVLDVALEMAKRAVALDRYNAWAQYNLFQTYLWRKEFDQAVAVAERSLELLPGHRNLVSNTAALLCFVGRHEDAIEMLQDVDTTWSQSQILGNAYRLAGRLGEAETQLLRAISSDPPIPSSARSPHLLLAIIYVEADRLDEAREMAQRVMDLWPDFSLEKWGQRIPYKDRSQVERAVAALRKAGLE